MTIDIEAMILACVPGGSYCDPQEVADAMREWAKTAPAMSEQPYGTFFAWADGSEEFVRYGQIANWDEQPTHSLRLYTHPAPADTGMPADEWLRGAESLVDRFKLAALVPSDCQIERSALLAHLRLRVVQPSGADEWKQAIEDAMICWEMLPKEGESAREALNRLLWMEQQVAIDPRVSETARDFRDSVIEQIATLVEKEWQQPLPDLAEKIRQLKDSK